MLPTREEVHQALAARHGEELQRRFADAHVAICGLGGLGSNIAIALARAGIGSLHLIDFDRVDLANLNRQQYAFDQLGQPKTEAMARTLARIAPYVEVRTDAVRLTDENLVPLLSGADIVCEAFDKAEAKAILVNGVLERLPGAIVVAASGLAGLGTANTIRTRRVGSRLYLCGDDMSDVDDLGTLYPTRAMLCAAHQAHMILRILAGRLDP